jgi:hypothetical protein
MRIELLETLATAVLDMTLRITASISNIWRSIETPPKLNKYSGWVKPGTLLDEYLVNLGTAQSPKWVEMCPIVNIQENVLYPTSYKLFG